MNPIKNVVGRPVTGEIERPYKKKRGDQKPIEDFVAALDMLFAFPQVGEVRWSQYTPSFNDGDPCVFTLGEFEVKLGAADPHGGDGEDGFLCEYGVNSHYGEDKYDYKNPHPISAALKNHFGYKSGDVFEDALEDAFGDPAQVTATREGFHVEYYDCGY